MKKLKTAVISISLVFAVIAGLPRVGQAATIYACYQKSAGIVKLASGPGQCNNNSEIPISWNEVGPQGAQGPAGPQGVAGPQGPVGPMGLTGPIGVTGPQGAKGDTGAAGPAGVAGPVGPAGAPGPSGPVGAIGPQGLKGETGATGPAGVAGPAGAQGIAGVAGPQGPVGATGPQGPKGDTGAAGPAGATGPQGPKGDTGAAGPGGAPGPQGPVGPIGLTGDAGPEGPQGPAGGGAIKAAVFGAVAHNSKYDWDNDLIISGTGFTASDVSPGVVTISFDPSPFDTTPYCTVTAVDDGISTMISNCRLVGLPNANDFTVRCTAPIDSTFPDTFIFESETTHTSFSFICVR